MIRYKVFDAVNMSEFINNEKLFKEAYSIVTQDVTLSKEYEERRLNFFKRDFKNTSTFVFMAFSENKLVGFLSGYTNLNNFNIQNLFVSKKNHSKAIGTKLKIYSIAYLRSKKGISNFVSLNVVNPKVYQINKRIVERKNISKNTTYSFEKTSANGVFKKNLHKIITKKRR
jgi:hypothetical protein